MADVYCYPDSSILKNKLVIHDKERLLTAEIKLAAIRLYQLQERPVHGNFGLNHLYRIHEHIFQDLYDWAGKIRTVNIAKSNMFCLVQHIQTYAQSVFPAYYTDCMHVKGNPEKFIHIFMEHYADLNALHPFRDGNGRVGRLITLKECLRFGLIPLIIEDDKKMYYYRGLSEWEREKGSLTDTCLDGQDTFRKLMAMSDIQS